MFLLAVSTTDLQDTLSYIQPGPFPILFLFVSGITAVGNAFSTKVSEYFNEVWENGMKNTFYYATTTVFLQICMT